MGIGEQRMFSLSASYKIELKYGKRQNQVSMTSSKSLGPAMPETSDTTWLSQLYRPINSLPCPLFVLLKFI